MSRSLLFAGLRLAAGLAVAAAVPASVYASTIQITPSNMGTWAFDNRDVNGIVAANPTGVGDIVTGPAVPPLGTGSAHLATGNGTTGGDGTEELRSTGYSGVLLSSLTTLSYSTYMTLNNGQQFPYFGLMISTTGGGTIDDIIFFEPPYQTPATGNGTLPDQGPTALNTWQTWDALHGGWWDNNAACGNPGTGVMSLASCIALFPNATILNTTDGLGGVRFNVGFASDTDKFNGYIDNFTIGINGANTTFDFDPNGAAASPVPEPASFGLLGLGLAGLAYARKRRAARQ